MAIIQARMSSKRLPGKVLEEIAGMPMLARVVERVRRARTIDGVVVATSRQAADDPVVALCREHSYSHYRGHLDDVLDRVYRAAITFQADTIVRLTADCPLIDPQVIDQTVNAFYAAQVDFAANRLPPPWKRTFPIGLDTEVCTFSALEQAWESADQPYQREHVMPYLYERTDIFRILVVNHDPDYGDLRWTVDTPEDLLFVRAIFDRLGGRDDFSWREVLTVLEREPELAQINAHVHHKRLGEC